MPIELFEMERMQSTWENLVDYDMSESGVRPLTLRELVEMGFDLDAFLDQPLGYSQSNGTIELRERLAAIYPGADVEQIEVTNGTSEANYLIALSQLRPGDDVAMEVPNYMQMPGVARSLGATVRTFRLRQDTRLGAGLGRVRARGHAGHAAAVSVEPEQPDRVGALRRARWSGSSRAARRPARGSSPTRCISARRSTATAHDELLGHERSRDRHERPLEGLRDSRRAHRLDGRPADARRRVLDAARLPDDRAQQDVGPPRARRRRAAESRALLRAHARDPHAQPADRPRVDRPLRRPPHVARAAGRRDRARPYDADIAEPRASPSACAPTRARSSSRARTSASRAICGSGSAAARSSCARACGGSGTS